jgi:hypothetical protein
MGVATPDGAAAPDGGARDHPVIKPSDTEGAVTALGNLLRTQEAQVLGAMGLFVGYICVFLAKIMQVTNPYFGVCGVAIITLLLLALGTDFDWRSLKWWVRAVAVIVICILITSPQLYFAWTVSVSEAETAAQAHHASAVSAAAAVSLQPQITVTNAPPSP